MSKKIVEHCEYGKVLLDTSNGIYRYLIPRERTLFVKNNKSIAYFNTFKEFTDSSENICVIPVVCSIVGHKGKRTFVELIDLENFYCKFFNVEMINYKWEHNNIMYMYKNKCYFVILKKNIFAMNDMIIMSSMEIKKEVDNIAYF